MRLRSHAELKTTVRSAHLSEAQRQGVERFEAEWLGAQEHFCAGEGGLGA